MKTSSKTTMGIDSVMAIIAIAAVLVFGISCGKKRAARAELENAKIEFTAGKFVTVQDPSVVKQFLDAGMNIDATDVETGMTALMFAAMKGNESKVKLLLERSAKVNVKCNEGLTALHYASNSGDATIARALLEAGADANARGRDDWTPLMIAARTGSRAVVEALISKGADVNAESKSGVTAQAFAKQAGHLSIVDLLNSSGTKKPSGALAPAGNSSASQTELQEIEFKLNALAGQLQVMNRDDSQFEKLRDDLKALVQRRDELKRQNPQGAQSVVKQTPTPQVQLLDSSKTTKAEWKKAVAPFNPQSQMFRGSFLTESGFKKRFGEPFKTQTLGGQGFWYYKCKDGTIQLVFEAEILQQAGLVIRSINDY